MAIESEISQDMREYVNRVLKYNKALEGELEDWEKFFVEYQKFSEFIQEAQRDYALLFIEAKQYENSLVPEIRDIEVYDARALEESEMTITFSRMDKDELLLILGRLQEVQELKVKEVEGDNSIALENKINALFLDSKVRFKLNLHGLQLEDIHRLTDDVKDVICYVQVYLNLKSKII